MQATWTSWRTGAENIRDTMAGVIGGPLEA